MRNKETEHLKRIERGVRLNELLIHKGLSQTDFAKKTGLTQGFISQIVKGDKDLSARVISSITKHYQDVSIPWLLSGTGSMYVGAGDTVQESEVQYSISTKFILERLITEIEEMKRRIDLLEKKVAK